MFTAFTIGGNPAVAESLILIRNCGGRAENKLNHASWDLPPFSRSVIRTALKKSFLKRYANTRLRSSSTCARHQEARGIPTSIEVSWKQVCRLRESNISSLVKGW